MFDFKRIRIKRKKGRELEAPRNSALRENRMEDLKTLYRRMDEGTE